MTKRWLGTLIGCAALLSGCKQRLSYEPPDLAASLTAFECGKSPVGDAAEACRMLREFESAEMVSTWPESGRHSWWGREICSDSLNDPKVMHFGWLHLMPGAGDEFQLRDIEHDPARTLAFHAELPTMTAGALTPGRLDVYKRLLDAIAKGTQPKLDGLEAIDKESAERTWRDIRELAIPNPPKMRLTRATDEKTVLATNATVGNDQGFVTYHNIRQKGDRLYQLKPSKISHCISELHRAK